MKPVLVEAENRAGEGDHAAAAAAFERLRERTHVAVADQLLHRRGAEQDFERRKHAVAVGARNQPLRDDADQRVAEVAGDLQPLLLRIKVDDAFDRLNRVSGVNGRDDEVPGHRRGQRDLDRIHVAHFADDDHVGTFTQRRAQCVGEARRARIELALRHEAVDVAVQEFDRVLDRDDMFVEVVVDVVDHRGERGRFAAAGRTDHDDDAALVRAHFGQRRGRQTELLEEERFARIDRTGDEGRAGQRFEEVQAEPFAGRQRVGRVITAAGVVLLFGFRGQALLAESVDLLRGQILFPLGEHLPGPPECRRLACGYEEVGCRRFHGVMKKIADFHEYSPLSLYKIILPSILENRRYIYYFRCDIARKQPRNMKKDEKITDQD